VLGTLIGSTLISTSGFLLSGIVGMVIFVFAVIFIWRFVPELHSHIIPERNA
jgi:hypothetical protein